MRKRTVNLKALGAVSALMLVMLGCASVVDRWQEQYDLGVKYLSEGDYQEAILAFSAAIEIDEKQALAYVGRGNAYVLFSGTEGDLPWAEGLPPEDMIQIKAEENLEAARADYQKAVELDETSADAYLGLADVYIRSGDYNKALEILQQGLEKTNDERLTEKVQEFEDGTITDSSGEIRAIVNERSDEGMPKYLPTICPKPGTELAKEIDRKSNLAVILDAGEYTIDYQLNELNNVIILGTEGTMLVSYQNFDTVAQFYDCKGLVLKNLTIGHELPSRTDSCSAGVLWFNNTEVTLINCDIFGCGKFGIFAGGADIIAQNTTIRDCSEYIMSLRSTNAEFYDCHFTGNGYKEPYSSAMQIDTNEYLNSERTIPCDSFSVVFSSCEFVDNRNPNFYSDEWFPFDSESISLKFENCTLSGNTWE